MKNEQLFQENRAEIDFSALLAAAIGAKAVKEAKKFEVVEQTPPGESLTWIVTPEQVARINAGDRAALDDFYFNNYPHIRASASSYMRKNPYLKKVASWEDLVQQVYCDLLTGYIKLRPYDKAISRAIYRSFLFAAVGGLDEIFIPYEKGEEQREKKR